MFRDLQRHAQIERLRVREGLAQIHREKPLTWNHERLDVDMVAVQSEEPFHAVLAEY